MLIRVADYIAELLKEHGINTVFTVVGGGAMHLNDAFGKREDFTIIHNHHEQACAMGAEGFAKKNGKMAAVCVTTGPGGTNTLTGILGAFQDNIPMIVISGQVRYSTTVQFTGLALRQFGEQEYCIVRTVSPMTKYAYMIKDPSEIKYQVEKAIHIATHGRRGPVWIDVPLDIQGASINTDELVGFTPKKSKIDYRPFAQMVLNKLKEAKAPLILAGASIRDSGAYDSFKSVITKLQIPIVSPTCVADIMPLNNDLYFQNFGIVGGRTGNFLVQNADVIFAMGCRLSFNQIGFNYQCFAPQAYIVDVDVDAEELKKPTLHIDMPIHADLNDFLRATDGLLNKPWKRKTKWFKYANELKEKFSLDRQIHCQGGVNPYVFIKKLMDALPDDGVVVTGNSSGSAFALHYGIPKKNQRLFGNRNCGSMGYDLPAAIGAAVAHKKMVVCLTGDGSLQMNLQELQTMIHYNIPIKLIVYCNNGYMGIVRTQRKFFDSRLTGCTAETGIDFPDLKKLSDAFGIPYTRIDENEEIDKVLPDFLNQPGYGICELKEDSSQGPAFKTTSQKLDSGEIVSAPLDRLEPALSEEEYKKYRYFNKEN